MTNPPDSSSGGPRPNYPGPTPLPPVEPVHPPSPPAPIPPAPAPPLVPPQSQSSLRSSRTIQGNLLAAFNKDHQSFRMLTLPADVPRARAWLAGLLGQISITEDVEDWNAAFSAARHDNGGTDPDMHVVWVGLTLTAAGIELLAANPSQVAKDLASMPALTEGPAQRAASLGDTGSSNPGAWLFGATGVPPVHAVVTVAADRPEHLVERQALLDTHDVAHGASVVFVQDGSTLPGDLAGHEHFGFKDGISQPGVIGFHEPGPLGDRAGHPGTKMLPAGDFVYGQPGSPEVPNWLHDGSAHVLRRLEQDVPAWRDQLAALASTITGPDGSLTPSRLAELMMGRAKDGVPLAAATDPARGLGDDDNDFDYSSDPAGRATPCGAHIRKTHPRAFASSPRIMRRGIPFGPPFDQDPTVKRGLVFNCFGTSIEGQFEFMQRSWSNDPNFTAGGGPTGPDPVIGSDGQLNLATSDVTQCTLSISRAVRTAGAVYGLALSIPTLHSLATTGELTP